MKAYAKYPTSIAALAFSPDGSRLAIACCNMYDNALVNATPEDANRVLLLVKETVADDCKVSRVCRNRADRQPKAKA